MPDAGNAKILLKRLKTQKPLQNCTGSNWRKIARWRRRRWVGSARRWRACGVAACGQASAHAQSIADIADIAEQNRSHSGFRIPHKEKEAYQW